MRRASIRGRRGALAGATAAVVCLGGLLAACGSSGGDGDGYVAVGAAGPTPDRAPDSTVPPTGDVKLVPLEDAASGSPAGSDAKSPGGGGSSSAPSGDASGGSGTSPGGGGGTDGGSGSGSGGAQAGTGDGSGGGSGVSVTPAPDGPGAPAGSGSSGGSNGSGSAGGTGSGGGDTATPSAPHTDAPAALEAVGDPVRKAADQRWCEDVTLTLRNTGGSAVRSGKVTFGTHIIGALGIDWATIRSTQDLPVPIDAGKTEKKTWTVCVDAWRVPLGMHVETLDVSVDWK
ncbi:hypothetical protein [Streptomyces sp. NPDC046821]|uniref:hypothetical protein n=1 Tax=Streptomyces sp. NPDC046821 TaxID=3154702 RepID=UPI0033F5C696